MSAGRDFVSVYEEHVWDVYGYLAYRLPLRADAEDLTQLTFERAFRAWNRYDERRASVRTWLLAIAKNALTDHHRRDRSQLTRSLSGEGVDETQLPSSPALDPTTLGPDPELARALARLTDREREVIALRFGGDLNGPQIADILGISVANVQQISSRALRSLRRQLEPETQPAPAHRQTPG